MHWKQLHGEDNDFSLLRSWRTGLSAHKSDGQWGSIGRAGGDFEALSGSLSLPLSFSHPAQMSILKMLGETPSCRVCDLCFAYLKATAQLLAVYSRVELPKLSYCGKASSSAHACRWEN